MAPEMCKKEGHGLTVDWWALGILLYEMVVGIPPFYDDDINEMYEKILNQKLRLPPKLGRPCKDFLRKLLDRNPSTRLGANGIEEIQQHPFFDGLDWDK